MRLLLPLLVATAALSAAERSLTLRGFVQSMPTDLGDVEVVRVFSDGDSTSTTVGAATDFDAGLRFGADALFRLGLNDRLSLITGAGVAYTARGLEVRGAVDPVGNLLRANTALQLGDSSALANAVLAEYDTTESWTDEGQIAATVGFALNLTPNWELALVARAGAGLVRSDGRVSGVRLLGSSGIPFSFRIDSSGDTGVTWDAGPRLDLTWAITEHIPVTLFGGWLYGQTWFHRSSGGSVVSFGDLLDVATVKDEFLRVDYAGCFGGLAVGYRF